MFFLMNITEEDYMKQYKGAVSLIALFIILAIIGVLAAEAAGYPILSGMFSLTPTDGLPPGCDPTVTPNLFCVL